ncbi:MAG: hypothetical protein IJU48_09270 [Synergistaceae bacterium]|nr:hypothetical protein [Synergistaceae bacterium]
MKKILAVVLVVSVVFAAGAAIAQPKRQPMQNQRQRYVQSEVGNPNIQNANKDFGDNEHKDQRPQMMPRNFAGNDRRNFDPRNDRGPRFAPDMPKEIREKVAELAKLKIDLEEALTSDPINKAKALEVHAKMQTIENEIDAWRFEKKLERMEEMRLQRELNKNVKPQAPAPKPEDKPEKPEAPAEQQ